MEAASPIEANPALQGIAHPLHTIVLLAAEAVMVIRAAMKAEQMRSAVDLNRVRMYERTMLVEWPGFAFVLFGLWLAGSSLTAVVGERWRSIRDLGRDLGIGVAFSIVSTILFSMFDPHHRSGTDRTVQFLLPHGKLEMALWVALSVTAGICEEALYRGYLQRQFMALTRNAPAGILLAAVAFGLAHSYQGWSRATMMRRGGCDVRSVGLLAQKCSPGHDRPRLEGCMGAGLDGRDEVVGRTLDGVAVAPIKSDQVP
jgi:hypothetical protein